MVELAYPIPPLPAPLTGDFPCNPDSIYDWSFSLTITLAMCWKTSFTLSPLFAEVSKKVSPCCSASCRPRSPSITLSGRSHLFATRTLATLEFACWSICFSQF
jgi:hypothetical protein